MLRLIRYVRRFNLMMHYVAGIALVGMLALTVADITGRSVFNNPVPGTVEVTAAVLVVIVFLGLARSEDLGDHITVDLLYVRVGDRSKKVLDYFADVMSVLVLGLMAYQLYRFGIRQADSGAVTPVLRWPIWPFVFIAALGSLGYAAATAMRMALRMMGQPVDATDDISADEGGIEI